MPQMMFTDRGVKAIPFPMKDDKPNEVQYFERLKEGRSLVLYVSYGGSKTWRVLFYDNGKPRTKRIGTYPELSIKDARRQADRFDADETLTAIKAGTFKEVGDQWVTDYVKKKKLRTTYEIERQLRVYIYPKFSKLRIFDIDRSRVNALLRSIEHKHGAPMADYVLATLRSIFNWYAVQHDKFNSPLVRGMNRDMREAKERARRRILDDNEIKLVWKTVEGMGTYGALVRMLLLTAQRLGCVKDMKRADIKDGVWTIPEQHREKGHIGAVILPKQALDIIERQPMIAGNPHVFPAATGKGPIASFSRCKADLNKELPKDMPDWVLHDLRRTARSLLSKIGVERDLAERVLGHTTGGVEETYDRYKYVAEKSAVLKKLADHVALIINPPDKTNVVPMRKRPRRAQARAG